MFCSLCARHLPAEASFCSTCGGSAATSGDHLPWAIRVTAPVAPVPAGSAQSVVMPTAVASPIPDRGTSIPWRTVVPVAAWVRDGAWLNSRWGVFAAFAFAPFLLLRVTADTEDITHVAWGFAVYFGAMWLLVIHQLVRPERPPLGLMAATVLTTAVAGVALAIWLEDRLLDDGDGLFEMILAVGFPEEIAKALPIVGFMLLRRTPATPRLYLFAGAVSGLAFGVTEAVAYSEFYGSLLDESSATAYTSVVVWRLLTDGLFHACFAGIAAFFIGLAQWNRRAAVQLVLVGVSLAAVLHGAYDHFAGGWIGTLLAAVIVFCFVGYARTGDRIALTVARPQNS